MTCEFWSREKETELNVKTKFKTCGGNSKETAMEKLQYYESESKEILDNVSPAEFFKRLKIEQVQTRGGGLQQYYSSRCEMHQQSRCSSRKSWDG